ncbi:3-hydroxyacyl-ACP dehydratase FabZ [Clostridium septicum]|uniref:3-hydroxyacyl-[acyl-carrier-protein] dehydratase FabZ n=1 Tax=Clostridium septicum TaxID=1504 RepID=A0A9N7JJP9_CLOSE|nr:3-hydroxyacyl-ACP dehydratase FabZ [Clostridium septicum]AYE33174.1 3-hydroxyacyl-[acyl-carrier-protein] dehydratase FabZ [Clostridium septicum]MDU1314171.1 3-hydroxyacyl-ACP dehydratase FabZ [Clostridium septicum]QAS61344.1 3-hydroxyacyl-ACP dehydratase FabZ [Clostridium septicum]UEC22223.1 3-hydroxyacyl-ACP dehydratase FabZ [Clostridium septicum]USR99747.1 3-hydroxyacyl-ACP dehydratase FabZ [Clostridium septicum]
MLGPKEIKEIIPHRYPFLLLDRVEEIVDGISAKGYKNVSINEPFFQGHYPDYPVMPGVLILEAMAQLGAVAVLSKEENKGKIPLFAGTNKVRWKKQVVPGDKLDLYVEIIKLKGPIGIGKGIATVDGVKTCEAELLFAIG